MEISISVIFQGIYKLWSGAGNWFGYVLSKAYTRESTVARDTIHKAVKQL